MLERLRFDVTSAWRALAATPALTITTLVTLAVAIGINLAMLGLVQRALSGVPRHVAGPDRLFTVAIDHEFGDRRLVMTTTSYATFTALQTEVRAIVGAAAWRRASTVAVVGGEQVQMDSMVVSGSYFEILGARPRLGRAILPADNEPASLPVAVLSDRLWSRAFYRDPAIVGRRIRIGAIDYTIAGVMPEAFSGHSSERVDIWVPFAAVMGNDPGWQHDTFRNVAAIVVRLGDRETPPVAEAQATAVVSSSGQSSRILLRPLAGADVAPTDRRIALWLTGVSVLVFVIGLANAATLLLVRAVRRRHEVGIRIALGATRRRLLGHALLETAMLGATAAMLSLVVASWFEEFVRRVLLPKLTESPGLDARILAAAGVAGFIAAVVGGTVSAAQFLRRDASSGVLQRPPRTHRPLLVIQTMLSVLLLAGAGMFGRSLWNLSTQDFGFRMHDVLLVSFDQAERPMPGRDEVFERALDPLRALPGIEAVSVMQTLPFDGHHVLPISVPGRAEPPTTNGQLPYLIAAGPELLDVLGVEIVEGRGLTDADDRGAPVVVVSRSLAQAAWGGERAIGQCIRIGFDPLFDPATATGPPGPPTNVPCREVVGVARDLRQRSVVPAGGEDRLMQYFVPFSQVPRPPAGVPAGPRFRGLAIRTHAAAPAMASAIRRIVVGGRNDLPFLRVTLYSDLLEPQTRPWRVGTALLVLFGLLALGVASLGLYAAFAHIVAERRREMAIRLALGAHPRQVVWMILFESARVAAVGIVLGCLAAVVAGRWLAALLFGTAPSDPLTLGSAALLMLLLGTIATLVPALNASRSDPNAVLRHL